MAEKNLSKESDTPKNVTWMLGLFDVLGFSERVKKEGVDKLYDAYQSLISNVIDKPPIQTFGMHMPFLKNGLSLSSMGAEIEISYTYFSDTILLWAPLLPIYPRLFLQRCADLVCEALLMDIPLRGAIAVSKGYMHKEKGIYLGEHIVDAARLEAAQEQIGVAFTISAAKSLLLPAADPTQFIEYKVPLKENSVSSCSPVVLDWARCWRESSSGDLIKHLEKLRPDDQKVVKYYNNAIQFAKWSIDHNDWHKYPDRMADFNYIIPFEEVDNKDELFNEEWLETRAHLRLVSDVPSESKK